MDYSDHDRNYFECEETDDDDNDGGFRCEFCGITFSSMDDASGHVLNCGYSTSLPLSKVRDSSIVLDEIRNDICSIPLTYQEAFERETFIDLIPSEICDGDLLSNVKAFITNHPKYGPLSIIHLDLGRQPLFRFFNGKHELSTCVITNQDLILITNKFIFDQVTHTYYSGLHRLSKRIDIEGNIIGISLRYGHTTVSSEWKDTVKNILLKILNGTSTYNESSNESSNESLLIVGPPNSGKTSLLREFSYQLSKEKPIGFDLEVLVIDTSNDIIGNINTYNHDDVGDVAGTGSGTGCHSGSGGGTSKTIRRRESSVLFKSALLLSGGLSQPGVITTLKDLSREIDDRIQLLNRCHQHQHQHQHQLPLSIPMSTTTLTSSSSSSSLLITPSSSSTSRNRNSNHQNNSNIITFPKNIISNVNNNSNIIATNGNHIINSSNSSNNVDNTSRMTSECTSTLSSSPSISLLTSTPNSTSTSSKSNKYKRRREKQKQRKKSISISAIEPVLASKTIKENGHKNNSTSSSSSKNNINIFSENIQRQEP
eukprot:gene7461-15266_t